MGLFTKKSVTIEAFRWTGGPDQTEDPVWIVEAMRDQRVYFAPDRGDGSAAAVATVVMMVRTNHGETVARPGDWIIRQIDGELYPCKDSVFQATYAPASREPDAKGEPGLTLAETQAVVETKTAPRVTEASIKALIADAEYFRVRHLTICIITLTNGFFVTGESAPAAVENYDQAVGERYAYENAFRKIWQLEGYRLRSLLADASL